MYKKIALFTLCCGLLSLNSCKPGEKKADTDENPVPAGMVRLDLTKAGINATIDVPDTTKKVNGIEAASSGSVHVFVGDGFQILINVSGEAMAMKKADINGDDLNKPKAWVVNDSNTILYSTQKDTNAFANAKEEFHFYAIIKKGATSYYVEDMTQGADGTVHTFGKEAAQMMLTSAKSITPSAPPAKKDPS
jgi:hypothetical protein